MEFAYNCFISSTTGHSPFEVEYRSNLTSPPAIAPCPSGDRFNSDVVEQSEQMKNLHEKVRAHTRKQNVRYMTQVNRCRKIAEFKERDIIYVHLRSNRFPPRRFGKLWPRTAGPFKILQKIGSNAYKVELLAEFKVSDLFTVSDRSPFNDNDNDDDANSWTSLCQP
ncbi:hypothetical protein Dimus_038908 [Dionaea muscipula]